MSEDGKLKTVHPTQKTVILVNILVWIGSGAVAFVYLSPIYQMASAVTISAAISGLLASAADKADIIKISIAAIASTFMILCVFVPFSGFRGGVRASEPSRNFDISGFVFLLGAYCTLFAIIFGIGLIAQRIERRT